MSTSRLRAGTALATLMAVGLTTGAAQASHFRGGAIVPTIENGTLNVTATTFWRPTAVSGIFGLNTSVGSVGSSTYVTDTTDSRFTRVVETFSLSLAGAPAQTITMSGASCCRVSGIRNRVSPFAGATSVSWQLNSGIVWDGRNDATPILFDFGAIQPEVIRGAAYADNVGAVSPDGLTLSYDDAINDTSGAFVPMPGYAIDPTTGAITIGAASTAGLLDNDGGNAGADYYFSGTIDASDGSFIEFDWLFDAVDAGSNLAPDVNDIIINALVGDTIDVTVTGSDPNGDPLTWDLLSFLPAGAIAPTFDETTQQFVWNTAGSAVGQYIANIRATDPFGLSGVGSITINLSTRPPTGVPEPATLALLGAGLLGFGLARRRRG